MAFEHMQRRAPVRANSFDPETRSFEAVISTGAPVERRDFDGTFLESLDLERDWPSSLPLLDTHRSWSVNSILGKVTGFRVENGELVARVRLSGRDDVKALARDIGDGIIDSLSIGYSVEKWREQTVNGQRHKAAAKWQLHEVSLVPIPADSGAKVRSGDMADEDLNTRAASRRAIEALADEAQLGEAFVEECVSRKLGERDARALAFQQLNARSQAAQAITTTRHNDVTLDNPQARRDALVDAFSSMMLGSNPSEPASQLIASGCRTLSDAARDCLERAGDRSLGRTPMQLLERAYNTTSDFPILLQETTQRVLAARFTLALSPVAKLARRKTAADFRKFYEVRLSSNMRLEPVGEGGELKAGTFSESKEPMSIASYGKTFALSFQAIANDDLGAFNQVAGDLATAAALTANDLVIGLIKANPVMLTDNKAVFHANHGNLLTAGSALGPTSLQAAVLAMRRQKGMAGELIAVSPTHIIVSPEDEVTARKLVATINSTTIDNVNPFAGAFEVVVERRFAQGDGWFLVDQAIGSLVDAYLSGYEGPRVETRPGWETLGTDWRCHMHYGVGFLSYQGWLHATGAA
jgi:HK97 family phage prohead protease